MGRITTNYRKGEIEGLSRYKDESYRLKLTVSGTETKWLTITDEELEVIKGILTGDKVNPEDELAEVATPDLVERYATLRASTRTLSHSDMSEYIKTAAELRERGVIN